MAVVTDPQLIERLNRLSSAPKTPDASSNATAGLVTDEALKERLESLHAKQIEEQQGSTEESETSAVPEGSVFGDFARTVGSIGSTIVAEPLSGLYGLATLAGTGGDVERAYQAVESAQEALTYTPETAGSQSALKAVGETLAPIGEGLETVSSAAGDTVYEWTGSPALAAAAYSLPTAALELAGFKGFKGVQKIKDADLRKAQKEALLDPELKYNGSVAEVKLNKKGQLVADKAGQKLVENGVRRNDAAVITNSSPATKRQMSQMVKAFEEGKGNDILAMSNKTTKAIGDSVTNRLQVLQTKRKSLGSRLEEIVKGPVGKTPVDVTDSLSQLNTILREEGVVPRIRAGSIGLPKDWYKGTSFDTKTMASARNTIEDAYKLFDMKTSLGRTDLKNAHKLKKNLDEFIDAAKLSESGMLPTTLRAVTDMRAKINSKLSEIDRYGAVNLELSEIIQAEQPFKKYVKKGQKWEDAKVSAVVGEAMKTLSNDSASSVELIADLSALDKTLKARGLSFSDDPRALVQFRQALLQNFNVEPSLPATGMARAAGGLAVSSAVGNTFGAAHDASRLISAGMSKKEASRLANQNKKAFNIIKMAVNQK